jgi:hypothetical protein
MNFWWVNRERTFWQGFSGKYTRSPNGKRKGQVNSSYGTVREVAPRCALFSSAHGAIRGFAMARTHPHTSLRPDECGEIGRVCSEVGWRVDINLQRFTDPVPATRHAQAVTPPFPHRHSPIRRNGRSNALSKTSAASVTCPPKSPATNRPTASAAICEPPISCPRPSILGHHQRRAELTVGSRVLGGAPIIRLYESCPAHQ